MLRQGHCSGTVLRILVGHLVFAFLLFRPALAILLDVFQFVAQSLDVDTVLDERVRGELRAAAAMLPFLEHNAAAVWNPVCYISDSSLEGYAVHCADLSAAEVETFA